MPYVTVEKRGRAGVIGLDRPKALNALDLSMIKDIATSLDRFEVDPTIELVVSNWLSCYQTTTKRFAPAVICVAFGS